tara:strand:+ start:172 stop:684 length:513 start_codon:yes stop_codon:yes gene_type:complete
MKSKKNLVLLGMMGSGKSTIGKLIAKKLNFKFLDIDHVIENQTKMKILEIFDKKGEPFFRNLEEKTTLKFLNLSNCVISLGGGAYANENIQKQTLLKSKTFWLNWDHLTLINRIKKSRKRPIASALNENELKNLIIKRTKYYSKAMYKIDCNELTKTQIVKKIFELYEKN